MARSEAIGLIETFGIVYAIEAADAMCKAADVELIGFENTASGYISVLTEGDVGACRTAVAAGCKAVQADRKCMERHRGECCTSAGACGSVCGDNRNCTLVSGELYERNRRSTF